MSFWLMVSGRGFESRRLHQLKFHGVQCSCYYAHKIAKTAILCLHSRQINEHSYKTYGCRGSMLPLNYRGTQYFAAPPYWSFPCNAKYYNGPAWRQNNYDSYINSYAQVYNFWTGEK